MKLVTNTQSPRLCEILFEERSLEKIKEIKVAMAYCKDYKLFEYCKENKIRLDYYGRLDYTINLDLKKLKEFLLDDRYISIHIIGGNKFHPKVIWCNNYGAYIGSANLTQSAWRDNIECGLWLTQKELEENHLIDSLNVFFTFIKDKTKANDLRKISDCKIQELNQHKKNPPEENHELLNDVIRVFHGCSSNKNDEEKPSSAKKEKLSVKIEEKILDIDSSSIEKHKVKSYTSYRIKSGNKKQFIRFYKTKTSNKMTLDLPYEKTFSKYDLENNEHRKGHEFPTKGPLCSEKYLKTDFIDLVKKAFERAKG